jgi:hypothetical protein
VSKQAKQVADSAQAICNFPLARPCSTGCFLPTLPSCHPTWLPHARAPCGHNSRRHMRLWKAQPRPHRRPYVPQAAHWSPPQLHSNRPSLSAMEAWASTAPPPPNLQQPVGSCTYTDGHATRPCPILPLHPHALPSLVMNLARHPHKLGSSVCECAGRPWQGPNSWTSFADTAETCSLAGQARA